MPNVPGPPKKILNYRQRRVLAEHYLKMLCCHYIDCSENNAEMFAPDASYFLDRIDKRYPHFNKK